MPVAIGGVWHYTVRIEEPYQVAALLEGALAANTHGQSAYLEFICRQFPVYGAWPRAEN